MTTWRSDCAAASKGNFVRAFALAGTAIAVLAWGAPALARQAGPSGASTSRPAGFQSFFLPPIAPGRAFRLIQTLPCFQLDLGSTQGVNGSVDVRGFAGTAGNVVIN